MDGFIGFISLRVRRCLLIICVNRFGLRCNLVFLRFGGYILEKNVLLVFKGY